jgi:acyl-CoA synthetase (AMP-forming)/AMP-acid ligase II
MSEPEVLPALSRRLAAALRAGGDRPAVEFQETWRSWSALHDLGSRLAAALDEHAPGAGRVGLIARNHPVVLAAMLGLIASGRTIVMLHGAQSPERLAAELRALKLAAVAGEASFWSASVIEAAGQAGSLAIALPEALEGPLEVAAPPTQRSAEASDPGVALELLSSGTTGPPKRIPIRWTTLEAALGGAHGTPLFGQDADALAGAALPPAVSGLSLGNIGGVYMILPSTLIGQRIVLLEKFAVQPWERAVRLYRPEILSVQPTGLRMILEAGTPPTDLASLKCIVAGASHLDPDLQDGFEERYGVRLFGAYGASEFCGSIVVWTDALYDAFRHRKRGSVGRPIDGVAVRFVDPATGAVQPAGQVGRLEAKVDRVGPDWIGTTDLGYVDEDGFVFITGRSDGAINRGGYKIAPEAVADVLRRHPAVRDAAVVGLPDARLGEVPVAAIEVKAGASAPSESELLAFARKHLLAYQTPARIVVTPELPRNASLKVMAPAVRTLFGPDDIAPDQGPT